MRAWNGSREPFTAVISRRNGWGWPVPRFERYEVLPSRTASSTLSITSSSACGRLHGSREAYWTRPPQLWRAPTMSWLMCEQHLPRLAGVVAEVLRLARELVHPPEADVAPRPRQLAVLDQAGERPADLQHAGAAAAVVVGRGHLLLDVRRQHDLLVVDLAAADPGLDHRLLGLLGVVGLDVDLDPQRLARGRELLLEQQPAPRRDHHREAAGRAVLDAVHALRLVRDAGPTPPGRARRSPRAGWSSTTRRRARRASTPPRARPRRAPPEASTTLPFTSRPA